MDPTIAVKVDDRVCFACFLHDVLGDVDGALVALGAERFTVPVDFVRVGALGAVRGVAGEGFHDIELVVVR